MRLLALLVVLSLLCGCDPRKPKVEPVGSAHAAPPGAGTVPAASSAAQGLGLAIRNGVGGVMIVGIDLEGPAAAAGAQVGDFIVAVNGIAIATEAEFAAGLAAGARGEPVKLGLWRHGERRDAAVQMLPPGRSTAEAPGADPTGSGVQAFGFQIRELPEDALKTLGVAYGLMVTRIRPPADRSRLLPGDVIVGVNQTPISSLQDFNRLLEAAAGGPVGLLVRRADSDLYIGLDPAGEAKSRRPTGTPLRT